MTMAAIQNSKLQILSSVLSQNIELVLDTLGVDYKQTSKKYYGACPVHQGDNLVAWNLYPNEEEGTPIWKCRTHLCHDKYKKTILGLIHGILCSQKGDMSFAEAINWACKLLNIDLDTLKIDKGKLEKNQFVKTISYFNKPATIATNLLNREQLRSRLVLPAEYYLKRGYSEQILDKYDVGFCNNPNKIMYNRVVVPIYDDKHELVVGTTARSIFEKCDKCKCYHGESRCPSNPTYLQKSKWINNEGFQAEDNLYNYWFAKKHIQETGVAILVEGPGDVWKGVEAGIFNILGMFKNGLTDGQLRKLEKSGALSLIVLTDNDEAGKLAIEQIKEQCGRLYRLYFPTYNGHDLGQLNTDYITSDIKPFIDKVNKLGIL